MLSIKNYIKVDYNFSETILNYYGYNLNEVYFNDEINEDLIKKKIFNYKENKKSMFQVSLKISFTSFKIELIYNGQSTITLNSQNLFNIEDGGETNDNHKFYGYDDMNEAVAMDFTFNDSFLLYGLPERAGDYILNDTEGIMRLYRSYNIDVFKYEFDQYLGLYGSFPVIFSKHTNFSKSKDRNNDEDYKDYFNSDINSFVIWNNPSQTFFDIKSTINYTQCEFIKKLKEDLETDTNDDGDLDLSDIDYFKDCSIKEKSVLAISETGILDISIFSSHISSVSFINKNNNEVLRNDFYYYYQNYIGMVNLPAKWSLGYHHSRWNFFDPEDFIQTDLELDSNNIPYDSLWLDIDHTEDKKYMTWNDKFNNNIHDNIETLDMKKRKSIVIIDPHLKAQNGYFLYDFSNANGK